MSCRMLRAGIQEYKDMHEYVWQHVIVAEGSENSVIKYGQINTIKDAILDWLTLTMPPDCFVEKHTIRQMQSLKWPFLKFIKK